MTQLEALMGCRGLERRRLLTGLLVGGSAGLASPRTFAAEPSHAEPAPSVSGTSWPASKALHDHLRSEEPFFQGFARQFDLDPQVCYFMTGQKGSIPSPVRQRLKQNLDRIARDPFPVYVDSPDRLRAIIAQSYGAAVDEIAISRNTTDALSQILMGIDWQAGDQVLVSSLEHPAGISAVLRLSARYRVDVREFGVPVNSDASVAQVVDSVRRRITKRTKVIFFSSPLWPNGMRMPERAIASLAQEYGITTAVDGAHYGGMIDPRLSDSGIDFWAISGHKWQCGPGGTGILYARNRRTNANLMPLPRFHLQRTSSIVGIPFDGSRPEGFDIGAALTNHGYPESSLWSALADSCKLWDDTGRARIEAWSLNLARYMRARIAEAFGPHSILQPTDDSALLSGIVAFNPFSDADKRRNVRLNEQLRRQLLDQYAIRISGGGVGPNGFSRTPASDAAHFPTGCAPNRHPVTLAPSPLDNPHRANACVWNTVEQVDKFVVALKDITSRVEA